MKLLRASPVLFYLALSACTAAEPTTSVRSPANDARPSQQSNDSLANTSTSNSGAQKQSGSNNAPAGQASGNADAYTFAEAQAQCIACHSSTSNDNRRVWKTADGNLDAWKASIAIIETGVNQMNMPLNNLSFDKKKFLNFLATLKSPAGEGGGANMPIALTFDTAKILCTGCHGENSNDRDARKEFKLSDTSQQDWIDKKDDIISAVNRNDDKRMPPSGFTDQKAQKAFTDFVNDLR